MIAVFKLSQLTLHVKILSSFYSRKYVVVSAWCTRKGLILDVQSNWEAIKMATYLGNFVA